MLVHLTTLLERFSKLFSEIVPLKLRMSSSSLFFLRLYNDFDFVSDFVIYTCNDCGRGHEVRLFALSL